MNFGVFFFFQAEDGIRDRTVTGVQTCALPISADHGEARGDHGELTHGLFAYESTLKIPLLVHQNGVVPHRVENGYLRHIDIVPTILERAGVAKPAAPLRASLLTRGVARASHAD